MNDAAETAAARLWRDRAQIREHERDEARAQARIAAEKVAILSGENDRLSTENACLRAQIDPDAPRTRTETEMQMEALPKALAAAARQEPAKAAPASSELLGRQAGDLPPARGERAAAQNSRASDGAGKSGVGWKPE